MYSIFFGLIFLIQYYHNRDPPLMDFISPFITLTISRYSFDSIYLITNVLLLIGLIIESIADFLMDKEKIVVPTILFAIGHLTRQLAFLSTPPSNSLTTILSIVTLICLVILFQEIRNENNISFGGIIYYSMIILLSAIHVSISQGTISWGYIIFIVSDLMIAYELIYDKINPRFIRVVLVPSLYWISQYLLTIECITNK